MRIGAYIRVSTTEQVDEGHSLDAQRRAIADHCQARGWVVVEVYEDAGFSGASDDRPAFQRLLADAESRCFDAVMVWKLDRFSRNHIIQGITIERFKAQGVRLIAIADGIDTASSSWLDTAIRGIFNEAEARAIRERARMGKAARAKRGKTNASSLPYGYRREQIADVQLDPEPDPEKAPAVSLAFESYATGQYNDRELAALLQREGFPTYGRKRRRWYKGAVRKMLRNPYYAGWVSHGGELYRGQHEPLVSQDLWDRVQAIRGQRNRGAPGGRPTTHVYLLHRTASCIHCGGHLHMVRMQEYRYYRDPAQINGYECRDAGQTVPMDVVDAQVAELVRHLRLPDDWRERLEELAGRREERENVEDKRKYIEGKLRRLRELYLDGDFTRAEYAERKADLQARLDALKVPDTPEVEAAGETLETLGDVWADASKRVRRDMLRTIFEGIYVDLDARRVVCVKPFAAFVPLFRLDGLREGKDGRFYIKEENPEARSTS